MRASIATLLLLAVASMSCAAVAYARTVLEALHEVDDALAAYGADQDQRTWLGQAVEHDQAALALARERYQSGLSTFIDVLDAERGLLQNQMALAASTTAVSTDLVTLYQALGGGWQSPPRPIPTAGAPALSTHPSR